MCIKPIGINLSFVMLMGLAICDLNVLFVFSHFCAFVEEHLAM